MNNIPRLYQTKLGQMVFQIKYFLLVFQKISKPLDWHKIQFPQCLLIHPMVLVLSVDTVVAMTTVVYGGDDELEQSTGEQHTFPDPTGPTTASNLLDYIVSCNAMTV